MKLKGIVAKAEGRVKSLDAKLKDLTAKEIKDKKAGKEGFVKNRVARRARMTLERETLTAMLAASGNGHRPPKGK
jgi:F420-0:gamma-glutamyl ligase